MSIAAARSPEPVIVPDGCPLTRMQYEVLLLLTDGLTYKQAAAELGVSSTAVGVRASGAYERLGVPNVAAAAVVFMRRGWHRQTPAAARPAGREPFPLPPFAAPYLEALDRHLADGDDPAAQRDMSIAAIGLTHRKPPARDRDWFLDRVISAIGAPRTA